MTGIARVTNFDATVLGAKPESDSELRGRAKATLQGLGKGTIAALSRAIFDENAVLEEIRDPNSPASLAAPGSVTLLVDTEPERFVTLQTQVNEVRAAGVLTTLVARYVFFQPRLIITIGTTNAAGKEKLVDQIIAALQAYVDGLKAGDSAVGQQLIHAIVSSVPQVKGEKGIRFADVLVSRADVTKPGTDTLTDALIKAVAATAPGDIAALRVAIDDVLSPNFSETRIPDRSLLTGPWRRPATDLEVQSGQFQVSSIVGGAKWSLVLDIQPDDIALVES
jgi:hypothetical protein